MKSSNINLIYSEVKPLIFCGREIGGELTISDSYQLPYETSPTEGEHDYNVCKGCIDRKKTIIEQVETKFNSFPLCCDSHKNLLKQKWFKKELLGNAPESIANKINYTYSHFLNNINSDNWYKEITDYIEYTSDSFGFFPKGCGESFFHGNYFRYLTHVIKSKKSVPKDRQKKILEYIKTISTPTTTNTKSQTNFNIVISTYEKWLKLFPFELSYFKSIKENYDKLPLFNDTPETNKYTGITKGKMHTKDSLIEALINLTNNLLTQVNGVLLYERGLISDISKIQVELIVEERKLELKRGYNNNSPNEEHRYRSMLKDWFSEEQIFWNKLKPLLNNFPSAPKQTKVFLDTKPIFKIELIESIFEKFKKFFALKHHHQLKSLLETGNNLPEKLIFLDNGNRLADAFKKLIENDIITGCQKQYLQEWIALNFCFKHKNETKDFTRDYIEKCISRNYYPCKRPILNVIDGNIS